MSSDRRSFHLIPGPTIFIMFIENPQDLGLNRHIHARSDFVPPSRITLAGKLFWGVLLGKIMLHCDDLRGNVRILYSAQEDI